MFIWIYHVKLEYSNEIHGFNCLYLQEKFNVDFYFKTSNKNVHLDVSGTAFIVWLTRANQTNMSKQSSVCGGSR